MGEGGDEGAEFALVGDKGSHDGADAEGGDIAAEDAGKEGGGDFAEDFMTEVPMDEAADAFVFGGGGGAERSAARAGSARKASLASGEKRGE